MTQFLEAVWEADPLRAFDGQERETYPSPLAVNATVRWESREFDSSFNGQTGIVNFHLSFGTVNWDFLRGIYGWAALQYQAWARSEITYHGRRPVKILLYPTNILEFLWNNQTIFGGDFFGFERAPVVLSLNPGRNTIRVRLIRDVRASGGDGPPTIDALLHFSLIAPEGAIILPNSLILPDVINGKPVSSLASITVCNARTKSIVISRIIDDNGVELDLLTREMSIVPGQSRPIAFSVERLRAQSLPTALTVRYLRIGATEVSDVSVSTQFAFRNMYLPHKITFLHYGGSVSYAIIRPPPQNVSRDHEYDLPIMVNLHGAGLDVDSSQVRHSFDEAAALPCWMIFPQGMSPWSGDDWHTWGMMDIAASLDAASRWSAHNGWRWPGIKRDSLIVTGHSNGGQGAWHFAMHHPDHVIAAATASGYASIQNYVPYVLWTEADPRQNVIIDTALSSFKQELFIENLRRTPVYVQHGSDDDNVPVYHSRLMTALAEQHEVNLTFAELPNKGHWFDGAMTTPGLLEFYREYCKPDAAPPPASSDFSFVLPISDDMSSRYGIVIDQLQTPDRIGRVSVTTQRRKDDTTMWHIKTTNVHRLHFDFDFGLDRILPNAVQLDDLAHVIELDDHFMVSTSFVSLDDGKWSTEPYFGASLDQRTGLQRGAMDSILRTNGPFQVVYSSGPAHAYDVAVQVSRNLLQYFGADAIIRSSEKHGGPQYGAGNIISIVLGAQTPVCQLSSFPMHADQTGIWLRGPRGSRFIPSSEGRGAAWLQQAAWKGHGGTLAMGFFDFSWNISAGSFLP